jgi:tRNA(Ile)-lysidine synthase
MTRPSLALADRAADHIRKHDLISKGDHVLVAVSGGPDSVALLDILTHLKDDLDIGKITVTHFDHRLRGNESDADRGFVEDLARGAALGFVCGTADVRSFAREKKISIEMAARKCRHSFFRKAARDLGAQKTALGHNLNDRAEEVLMRLLRGSGPAGLKGMTPAGAEGIIRPVLFATREEIVRHLIERRLAFREDSSNREPFCQRNALRLRVFPIIEQAFHPEVARTIARYADLAADEEAWWDLQVNEALDRCQRPSENGEALDLGELRKLHPALLRRVLRRGIERVRGGLSGIHLVHLEPLFAMALGDIPGRCVRLPGGVEAVRCGGNLLLRLREANEGLPAHGGPEVLEVPGPGAYRFGGFIFEICFSEGPVPGESGVQGQHVMVMDAGTLQWPLCIRYWKPGDRFRPLGMRGSKKLQDFFTDSRVPRETRRKIPIVCDRDKICWVAGFRLDDRVKTGPETGQVVSVRMTKEG